MATFLLGSGAILAGCTGTPTPPVVSPEVPSDPAPPAPTVSPAPAPKVPAPPPSPAISSSGNLEVLTPVAGARITSPLVIGGRARVFESRVSYRLRAQDVVLGEGAVSAKAPDMGQFGPFEAQIPWKAPEGQSAGTLEVFSISPKDGSEDNKITLPVVLQ